MKPSYKSKFGKTIIPLPSPPLETNPNTPFHLASWVYIPCMLTFYFGEIFCWQVLFLIPVYISQILNCGSHICLSSEAELKVSPFIIPPDKFLIWTLAFLQKQQTSNASLYSEGNTKSNGAYIFSSDQMWRTPIIPTSWPNYIYWLL